MNAHERVNYVRLGCNPLVDFRGWWLDPRMQHSKQRPPCQEVQRNDMHPIAPQRRSLRSHFIYLYRLVLTRSRAAECRKANHFLAHLALLVGPETLSRPATAQKLSNCLKYPPPSLVFRLFGSFSARGAHPPPHPPSLCVFGPFVTRRVQKTLTRTPWGSVG
jgi:hypothetical protein